MPSRGPPKCNFAEEIEKKFNQRKVKQQQPQPQQPSFQVQTFTAVPAETELQKHYEEKPLESQAPQIESSLSSQRSNLQSTPVISQAISKQTLHTSNDTVALIPFVFEDIQVMVDHDETIDSTQDQIPAPLPDDFVPTAPPLDFPPINLFQSPPLTRPAKKLRINNETMPVGLPINDKTSVTTDVLSSLPLTAERLSAAKSSLKKRAQTAPKILPEESTLANKKPLGNNMLDHLKAGLAKRRLFIVPKKGVKKIITSENINENSLNIRKEEESIKEKEELRNKRKRKNIGTTSEETWDTSDNSPTP